MHISLILFTTAGRGMHIADGHLFLDTSSKSSQVDLVTLATKGMTNPKAKCVVPQHL